MQFFRCGEELLLLMGSKLSLGKLLVVVFANLVILKCHFNNLQAAFQS